MKLTTNTSLFVLLPTVIIGVFAIVSVVSAATTIGTDIATDGAGTFGGGINLTAPTTFLSSGTPGDYTLAKSGIVVKNDDGDEIFRIWGTDPDESDWNSNNLYIGRNAGAAQPTDNVSAGYFNVGIGTEALAGITEGTNNTAVGFNALKVTTVGYYNAAIGDGALGNNTTGIRNVAVGHEAMQENVVGDRNVAIGDNALELATGNYNTAVGSWALDSITTGERNVMVGSGDSAAIVAGNDNVVLGYNAGPTVTDTSNSIVIGSGVDVTTNNTAVIGNASVTDVYFGSGSAAANTHAFGATFGGNVGIGTTTPIANFQVANGANATTTAEFGSSGQNKGSCLKLYRTDGSAIYAYVAAGATAFTLSTTACATVTNF